MISFEQFVPEDNIPIYLQIIGYVKRGIVAGTIRDGDEIPSRRMLSALLGVNPNTVQHSLEALERNGILYSIRGSGWYVAENVDLAKNVLQSILAQKTADYFAAMALLGMDETAVKEYVKEWRV